MAIAGLHNLSAFSPLFGESRSRQWGDEPGTPSTRASSLLQMWRELECDHVVSPSPRLWRQTNNNTFENIDETENQAITGSETGHDDNNSIIPEQSSDLGGTERERVKQIFREWMNSVPVGHSSNELHLNSCSCPQWLGENECERVRVIREWVQMNSQQRGNNRGLVRDGGVESGLQIEQVRDGLIVSHPGVRRPIRRLCGRQTLLDLLHRAQCERKEELQGLLEQRPVSNFTHRNRIQAFLRGRFLRNERVILNERTSSVAATELGLLRQRHTVSGLREGFLSKLESSASSSANSADADSIFGDPNNDVSECTRTESEIVGTCATLYSEIPDSENRRHQEFVREVNQEAGPVLPNVENEQHVFPENGGHDHEVPLNIERIQQEVSLDVRIAHSTDVDNKSALEIEDICRSRPHESLSQTEDINQSTPHEFLSEADGITQSEPHEPPLEIEDIIRSGHHELPLEFEDIYQNGPHESATATHEMAWQQLTSVVHSRRTDGSGEWQESSANQLFPETSDNDVAEQDRMQELHEDWPSHDLQEAIDSWLDNTSGERRVDIFYFSDDDNVHGMELQELFSRRRVSSLLRSSFRESLDQVLQSHVERLGHASGDLELENASSSPSLVEQDPGQQNGDRALDLSDAADRSPFALNPFDPISTFGSASHPLWDEEMQGSNLPYDNLNQHLGTEWEVVNELRIDMARLQQRLNNMQSMLEQCMDMQIELQRSVRQEVSSALNRSIVTIDASKGTTILDESHLEYVRRGICCLCRASNIDSLLYRCGHMCSCSNCAHKLIQDTGKCPMCWAPVVEAVRAYFIQ